MTNRRWLLILSGILLITFLLRLAFIHEPLERDEGLYAYVGQVILDGGLPYRDAIDHKPPGIHYLYAAMIALAGPTVEAIRLLTALYTLMTVSAVYWCGRRLWDVETGLAAACCYGVFSSLPLLHGSSSNTEVFMALPVALAVSCWFKGDSTGLRRYFALSGLAVVSALLIKTVVLPVTLLLAALTVARRRGSRKCLGNLAAFLLPQLFCGGMVIGYFVAQGAWADFFHWNITFNRNYGNIGVAGHLAGIGAVLPKLAEHLYLWVVALPTAGWLMLRARSVPHLLVVLLLVATLIGVAMPGQYFPHYFIQTLFPLSLLAGYGLTRLARATGWQRPAGLALAATAFAGLVALEWRYFLVYTPEEVSIQKYGMDNFVKVPRIARYIRERTRPDETIFLWGFESELYFLTDRRAPNPFTADLFVGASRNPAEAIRLLTKSIRDRRPVYVVVINQENEEFPGFRELERILASNYFLEKELEGASLFRFMGRKG